MSDKEMIPQIKQAVIGLDREQANKLKRDQSSSLAVDSICVFFDDKTAEVVDLTDLELDKKKEVVSEIDARIKAAIKNPKKYITLYTDDPAYIKIKEKAEKMQEQDDKKDSKLGAILVAGGAIAVAAAIGIGGLALIDKLNNKDKNKENTLDQNTETNDKNTSAEENIIFDLNGKPFSYYSENAVETSQKTSIVKMENWLSKVGVESWSRVTLTEEQIKEYNLTNPECVFGLTAEEAYALSLRFGHFTNDEYVTLTGGSNIDVVSVLDSTNSLSNNALSSIISYYICSDECNLNIDGVINFNEKEQAKIAEVEAMLAEWKALTKEEDKEKEAFAKMQEIKAWFNEFAYEADPELNSAKSYLLRTVLPACSMLSQIYQYQDTTVLEVHDTKNDENTTKKIKTALFDELMMRNLVTGFDGFDEEKYLKENNISSSRYTLNLSDEPRSIADKYVSEEVERLNQVNEYVNSLRMENTIAESAFAGSLTVNPNSDVKIGDQISAQMDNVHTKFDELTEGTFEISELLELINIGLKEQGLYPENIEYFRTAKLSELHMAYNSTHGVTQGKKGDKITTKEEQKPISNSDLSNPNFKISEEEMAKAREEAANKSGIADGTTEEASKKAEDEERKSKEAAERAAMLQSVYDVTYNFYYTGNSSGYNAGWASSSDSEVVVRHNNAKADAENRKRVEAEVDRLNKEQNSQPVVQPQTTTTTTTTTTTKEETKTNDGQESTTTTTETKQETTVTTTPPTNYSPVVDDNANDTGVVIDPEFVGAEMYGLSQEDFNSLFATDPVAELDAGESLVYTK